jgi:hypothetical protein
MVIKHFIAIIITQNKIKRLIPFEKQACISTAHQLNNNRILFSHWILTLQDLSRESIKPSSRYHLGGEPDYIIHRLTSYMGYRLSLLACGF